jgi:hypothetical protein
VNIIGLVGFIGSGKGTVGDILEQNGYWKESFAAGVKDTTAQMFNWDRYLLEGDTEYSRIFRETPCPYWSAKFGRDFTPREALQRIGTEVGRDVFHSDFWVMDLEKRLQDPFYYESGDKFVITDVRFPNEIEWIKKQGGKIYEVQRGSIPEWYNKLHQCETDDFKNIMMVGEDIHYSEWAWVGCNIDGLIKNNGTLKDLTKEVERVIMCKHNVIGDNNETV